MSLPGQPVFRLEEVGVRFGEREVLGKVTLDIGHGGVTVITGPSGAGKTTLLRLCNRLEVPSAGRILFHGRDVATLDPLALRRRVGMVFQRPALFAGTVRDNLRVARPASDAAFRAVLERVGLRAGSLEDRADTLSGGEAQRACLARTLLTEPEVLLMDEPTSSLDASASEVLEDLTSHLVSQGLTVAWVSHDLAQARRIADRTVVLLEGRIASGQDRAAYLNH